MLRYLQKATLSSLAAAFGREKETEKAAAKATGNVGKIRDVIRMKRFDKLFAEEQYQNKDKSKGYFTSAEVGKRGQKDHHKYNTGSAHEAGGKKQHIEDAGYQRGDDNHDKQGKGAVAFFQHGADKEDQGKITYQVTPISMTGGVA